jgi:hypothetical protein
MVCRNCGLEIADKALLCYRCGTATTEAKYKPSLPSRRGWSRPLLITLVVLAIALVAFYLGGR